MTQNSKIYFDENCVLRGAEYVINALKRKYGATDGISLADGIIFPDGSWLDLMAVHFTPRRVSWDYCSWKINTAYGEVEYFLERKYDLNFECIGCISIYGDAEALGIGLPRYGVTEAQKNQLARCINACKTANIKSVSIGDTYYDLAYSTDMLLEKVTQLWEAESPK